MYQFPTQILSHPFVPARPEQVTTQLGATILMDSEGLPRFMPILLHRLQVLTVVVDGNHFIFNSMRG